MRNNNTAIIASTVLICSLALVCKGEARDKTILDSVVNELVEKDPNDHNHRIAGAFFYFNEGYFADAEKHFQKASEITPDDPYDQAWLYMAQLRQNSKESGKALKAFLVQHESDDFIFTNIQLLLGEVSPENAIKKALASKDQGNVCEAYYYAGQYFWANGQTDMAKKCFKKAIQTKKETYWEYRGSVASLKTLD